jgi:hypothetical protein
MPRASGAVRDRTRLSAIIFLLENVVNSLMTNQHTPPYALCRLFRTEIKG